MTAPIPANGNGPGHVPPVVTSADVLAILPAFMKRGDPAPVRDGLVAALTAILLIYQADSAFAAWSSDVLHAEGTYLDGLGTDRQILRAPGELDPSYRMRLLDIPSLVTPAAILLGVNAILAPYTAIQAQYFESVLDRWYLSKGHGAKQFHSFVWSKTTTATNKRSPFYAERLYEDDAMFNASGLTPPVGGAVSPYGTLKRPQSSPGGARVFRDQIGRMIVLRLPDLSQLDNLPSSVFRTAEEPPAATVTWVPLLAATTTTTVVPTTSHASGYWYQAKNTGITAASEPAIWPTAINSTVTDGTVIWRCAGVVIAVGAGMFIFKHVHAGGFGAFMRNFDAIQSTIYSSIAGLVDRIRGSSIRVEMFVDPKLR